MKRMPVLLAVLLLAAAPVAQAADLTKLAKAYFGSTKPGTWVKYEQTLTDAKGKVAKSEVTFSRLEGDGARVWFEMRAVPKEGAKGKPTTLRYLLNTDFQVEKNALDFMKHIEKIVMQEDGKEATEFPAEMLQQVGAAFVSNVDYGANLVQEGSCSADGKGGDKYRMQGSFDVKVLFMRMKGTTDTEICMSDTVPFGRLHEKTVTKDDKGRLMSTSEMRLLDSGTGATSSIKGPVKALDIPKLPFGG